MQNEVILLFERNSRTYSKGNIRNIRYSIVKPDRIVGTGISVTGHKIGAELAAKKATGIFFELADIDYPEVKIIIKDEKGAQRNYEILQQFMDGTLKPYDEYMAQKGYNN